MHRVSCENTQGNNHDAEGAEAMFAMRGLTPPRLVLLIDRVAVADVANGQP